MVKKLSSLLLAALLLVGCSIDYNEEDESIKKSKDIPDSTMVDFHLINMKNNKPSTIIKAQKAEIYNERDITILHNIEFKEYNKGSGEVVTEGKVALVEYSNESKNAIMSGGFDFNSIEDDIQISGENLNWVDSDKVIESDINSPIKITKGDGTRLEGLGFKANVKDSTFSFEKGISGYTP